MKLTAVSLLLRGRRYTAFVMLDAVNPVVTEPMLAEIFPAFRQVGRGVTYSIH